MAYQKTAINAITDVPALVAAFALARGWTVVGTTLTRTGVNALSFEVTADITGDDHTLRIEETGNPTTRAALQRLPLLKGTSGNPVVQVPTNLHLFGAGAPSPYVAGVIECGFNRYRHFYIGGLDIKGDYTGGNIIAANNFYDTYNLATFPTAFSTRNRHMFSALTRPDWITGVNAGGVDVVHAGNAIPWRMFDGPYDTNAISNFVGDEVFGGHADGVNEGLVFNAKSPFSGESIMVPVDLYVPDGAAGAAFFRPIGQAPGVRLMNMESIETETAVSVGGDNWRVFPEFRRNIATTVCTKDSGYYIDEENSGVRGLAYKE